MIGESETGSSRRGFFHEAVGRTVRPLADYLEQRFNAVTDRRYLRPPGAIDEKSFIKTCYRCGSCVDECPVNAILALDQDSGEVGGTPIVDPDVGPCVLCDGLKCTNVCPSGVLLPVSVPHRVRMGLAEVYRPMCLRTKGQGCRICVDQCRLGIAAIRLNDAGPPEIVSPGCVGCGACQFHCPTSPKAIVVRPL